MRFFLVLFSRIVYLLKTGLIFSADSRNVSLKKIPSLGPDFILFIVQLTFFVADFARACS
jgi:hypothetical protein